ncbi:MAG: transcription termination/antitermination protein NusG [Candidatus Anammoxibacter sp.]
MPKDWFVLRVQSNKESQVKESLDERIASQGMESLIANVLVPSEKVSEIKGGQKKITDRKIFPGYIMAEIEVDDQGEIPDDVWYLLRETPGAGDFVGSKHKPVPMARHEAERILGDMEGGAEAPKTDIDFSKGDKIRINEGPFENYDGIVEEILSDSGRIKVILNIFGRATPVELEYWQVEVV